MVKRKEINPEFNTLQVRWIEDTITTALMKLACQRRRWGLDPCQECIDVIEELLKTVRGLRNDDESETI